MQPFMCSAIPNLKTSYRVAFLDLIGHQESDCGEQSRFYIHLLFLLLNYVSINKLNNIDF